MKKNEKGFTLVELIVVIAIVAILASVGIVGYTQFIQNARNTKAQSELDQIVNVLRADAMAEGITQGSIEVTVEKGKLKFEIADDSGNPATDLADLLNQYEIAFEGTITLSNNELTFKPTAGGEGSTAVTYTGDNLSVTRGKGDAAIWEAPTVNPGDGGEENGDGDENGDD